MSIRSFPVTERDSGEDDYYRINRESGVLSGLDLTLPGGNVWSLSPGEMFCGGMMMLVESTPISGQGAPSSASPRRDMLVARRTLRPNGGSNTVPTLLIGAPAANPTDPVLTQERVGVWEEPLFSWRVPATGQGTTYTDVRDLRLRRDVRGELIKPRARLLTTLDAVPSGLLYGIGQGSAVQFFSGNGAYNYVSPIVDGLFVAAGIYTVTFNVRIQDGAATRARSLLDIVGAADTDTLSRAPMTWPGEDKGTNSTTLFLPVAQPVRFIMYITGTAATMRVITNVDIVRVGEA